MGAQGFVRMAEPTKIHLCNAWLPPPVFDQLAAEKEKFHVVIKAAQSAWKPEEPHSRYATLKWISVINNFLKAKSDVDIVDVQALAELGLQIFKESNDYLFVQVRWGHCILSVLKKYRKKLNLTVEWRPLYELLLNTHFKRRHSYEGLALKQTHLELVTSLVRSCHRYFPTTAAAEIWAEFRPSFEDLPHNMALEAVGFMSLFLPTKSANPDWNHDFFTTAWLEECLKLWSSITSCHFWNLQWSSLVGRYIQHCCPTPAELEYLMPDLFVHFLRSFEVPVGKASASSPVQRAVPREVMLAFNSGWSNSNAKVIAKAIVFLLHPGGSAQRHLDVIVELLEQYYHPSNGGTWTAFLEQFLRYLAFFFLKRLAKEQGKRMKGKGADDLTAFLGVEERVAFVKCMLKLIERGQYSKNGQLARTAADAATNLAYVEPSLVLPLVISGFQTAMDTITATHQLESALNTLALAARSILLVAGREAAQQVPEKDVQMLDATEEIWAIVGFKEVLVSAMFNTLPGMDANDPPKTLATLRFYFAVISSILVLGGSEEGGNVLLPMDWSLWLDEFLSRFFVLLVHLEPSTQSGDVGVDDGFARISHSFLLQRGSVCHAMIELLFGRLTKPLFRQGLKKVAKFVHTNVLPGASDEIGLLCRAAVYASPSEAAEHLLKPIMTSIIAALEDAPVRGLKNQADGRLASLSPALATSVSHQIDVLALAVTFGGAALLPYKELLDKVILAAFAAPSTKVNEAGSHLLSNLLGSMIRFYPLEEYKFGEHYFADIEAWMSIKDFDVSTFKGQAPVWHSSTSEEITYANELLDSHLRSMLPELLSFCQQERSTEGSGQEKEELRVVLLRMEASLHGVRSCLPDFKGLATAEVTAQHLTIAGAAGATVGSVQLREETANTLHIACESFLRERADDTKLLLTLVRVLGLTGNYGALEFDDWLAWRSSSRSFLEPQINLITGSYTKGQRRPQWFLIEKVYLHSEWRASQAGYRPYTSSSKVLSAPTHVVRLSGDLLKLSLHNYDTVRGQAANTLGKMLKRFPVLVKGCMPVLTAALRGAEAVEEAALGACRVLMSRHVIRCLMQDWHSFTSFLLALLNSSHLETIKAQAAINELFVVFYVRFGGVLPNNSFLDSEESGDGPSYDGLITQIKNFLAGTQGAVHWRYILMAHAILLLLVLPPQLYVSSETSGTSDSRKYIAGQFFSNLKSELPPLRPMSVIALQFLLQSPTEVSAEGKSDNDSPTSTALANQGFPLSVKDTIVELFQDEEFFSSVVQNLAFDHHYPEGPGRSGRSNFAGSSRQRMSDLGITAYMPSFIREWPRTRTWDSLSRGEAFSANFARVFEYLVQECGSRALAALHGPLEEASNAVDERGKQCVAAEIFAGILHSDAACVLEAWDAWLGPLLRKVVMQANLESVTEWAACIRFAMTRKGNNGLSEPLLSGKILDCLVEPVSASASTSLVARRFTLLQAAIMELRPGPAGMKSFAFQEALMTEVMSSMAHPAAQVRESVGNIMCVLLANLTGMPDVASSVGGSEVTSSKNPDNSLEGTRQTDWSRLLNEGAAAAAAKIQIVTKVPGNGAETSPGPSDSPSEENKEAVKWMETALYFMIACIKSGRAGVLIATLVGLIKPLLCLQDTSEKELSALAMLALRLLNYQPCPATQLPDAVASIVASTEDTNWHTRVAALMSLQSFSFRHTFIMSQGDSNLLWKTVQQLIFDPQLEVRELAAETLAGMMKGADQKLVVAFREKAFREALSLQKAGRRKNRANLESNSVARVHGTALCLAACVLSSPYDVPLWLPDIICALATFVKEVPPTRATVTKTIAEFRRTHSDTWAIQKGVFSEEQLDILSDLSTSASYFA